jgi:signal transduction histidine kinase
LTELLEVRYARQLDGEAPNLLRMLKRAASDAGRLVDGLVSFADASVVEPQLEAASAEKALEAALALLEARVLECGASLNRAALPKVRVSEKALTRIFEILLSNALTYRGEEPPTIQIAAEPDGSFQRISVADNGIGIAPEYHDLIFAPLKRLHGYDIAGTGLGLAIASCLVQRHGGRIWVDSEPGKGATFSFTLLSVADS